VEIQKDLQYWKFCFYGFLKNLKFFEPFLFLFYLEMGFSYLQIGVLFSIQSVTVNLLEIPTGFVADSLGRRRSMLFSFISYICSFLIFYFLPYYGFYIVAVLFFAFGEAFRTGTHKAMILDYLDRQGKRDLKIHYYGHTRSWSQRGSAVSSLIAAGLVFYSGSYRTVFLFTLIPYVFLLFLMLSYPSYLDGTRAVNREAQEFSFFREIFREFAQVFRSARLGRTYLTCSLGNGYFESVKNYIQPILERLGLALPILLSVTGKQRAALVTGVMYFIIYILTSVASGSSGTVSDRLGNVRRQLNGSFLAAMVLIVLIGVSYQAGWTAVAVGAFLLYYFLQNVRRPIALGYLSGHIKNAVMATGLSAESQLSTASVALLAPLIGWVSDRWGLGTALASVGALGVVLFPLIRIPRGEDA